MVSEGKMPAFQVGILAEWRPIPWHQRQGVRLSFYVFLQICLAFLMLTIRLEQVDANESNDARMEKQIEAAFVGNATNVVFNETKIGNKIQAVYEAKDSDTDDEMKKKPEMQARMKKKSNTSVKVQTTTNGKNMAYVLNINKSYFIAENVGKIDIDRYDIDAQPTDLKRLKRDDHIYEQGGFGINLGKSESCAEGCALLIINELKEVDIHSSTTKQYLFICYPSLYDAKGFGLMKITNRFKLKSVKSKDNLCDICEDCDEDRTNWHGIKLNWEKDMVTIESSLWEGSKIITEMVKNKFEGNVSKFLDALFDEGGNKSKDIFNAGSETNFLYTKMANEDGAFFQDFNWNENEAIILLHLDISTSLNYVNKHRNEPNSFRIWFNYFYMPNPYLIYTLDEKKRSKICEEEVNAFNGKVGEILYEFYERVCLLNRTEEENLYGVLQDPPSPDGQNQTWGGRATGPLPYPEPETLEDEKKKYNNYKVIERSKKYGFNPSNRIKRQDDPLGKCTVYTFDVREKFPQCFLM